jgi:acetyl-CoA/propionyl-CoA carboxylase carboxyl transferase subunit
VGWVEDVNTVAFASDARVKGGAMTRAGCAAILCAYELAMAERAPIIGLWQSGGAQVREGVSSLHAVGQLFHAMTNASGVVPQISVVLGPAAGGAAYGSALTDIVIMSGAGRVFVTGPDVVRGATGEEVDMAGLGGPDVHSRHSGVAHIVENTGHEAIDAARRLVGLLCSQGQVRCAAVDDIDFSNFLPGSTRRAYDVRPLVKLLLDEPGVELQPRWAPNIVTTLGRLGGRTVGIVANNPLRLAGCLDSLSAEKAARFVRMCDAFGIPMIVIVDVPGYLPGVKQEWGGIVRRGAKLLHAFAGCTVPRLTLITRKAYGGAYIAMNSRCLGATTVLAWPTAEIAVMDSTAAVRLVHRRLLALLPDDERADEEARLTIEHESLSGGLDRVIETGALDAVIAPELTRSTLARLLSGALCVRGERGNTPL